jgi:ketosteroid isomerase-like protein
MTQTAPLSAHRLLTSAYQALNARDIAAALSAMHPHVEWMSDSSDEMVCGRDEVRDYWLKQWDALDPQVEPVRIDIDDEGQLVIAVHHVVKTRSGHMLAERFVEHACLIEDGLIKRLWIRLPRPDQAGEAKHSSSRLSHAATAP